MTTKDFIAARDIKAYSERVSNNPHMDDSAKMDNWRVRLHNVNRRFTVYFSMGYGHNGKEPTASDVLDCLASDSAGIENARDFADWCSDFGYDTDSRKAHKTFTVCERQAERLKKFLGESDYQALLFDTERL